MRRIVIAFGVLIAMASPAHAQHVVTLIAAADGCPSDRAFGEALRLIFPDVAIETATANPASTALRVELSDSGARYRVVAGTAIRELVDPAMRCDERARNAAVFVALVLEPPTVAAPVAIAAEPPAPLSFPSVQLGLGALLDAAPRSQNTLAAGGGRLELAVGGETIAAVASIDAVSPTTLDLGSVRARLTRVPFSLGARGTWRRGRSAFSLDAAAVMAIQITRGLDTSSTSEQTRLELGVRVAARFEYRVWKRVAPFVAIQAEGIPSPYDLIWSGMGIVGTTPPVWLGGVIGCDVTLR